MTEPPEMTDVVRELLDDALQPYERHPRVRYGKRGELHPFLRQLVYERDGRRCRYCGSNGPLQLDHVLPWSAGGSDTSDNLRTLCASCNQNRSNWREWIPPRLIPVVPVCDPCCISHSEFDEMGTEYRHRRYSTACPVCIVGEFEQDMHAPRLSAFCGTCGLTSWTADPSRLL